MTATLEDAVADPRQTIVELEQRLRELTTERDEVLKKQTATAEILRVISGSPTDLQPTFDAIAARATRLSDAVTGVVFRFDGLLIHYGASYGMTEAETNDVSAVFPLPPSRGGATARAILTHDIVHIHDPAADPDFTQALLVRFGTILSIPMLRDGNPLGAITVTRQRVEPFAPAQIDLLKTFADQAVIAIENVRLFSELRASLDRQTATSEVLGVISSSPGQLQPVFEKLLECALRLCHAHLGTIARVVDGAFTAAASSGDAAADAAFAILSNYRPPPNSPLWRMLATKATVQVPDYAETPAYAERAPGAVALVELGGARTALQVPLLKDGEVVGGMTIYRREVRPFDDEEVALVENFAAQAVIAIENVRLLGELRARTGDLQELLEYQTATSDVLKVISRSSFDLQPVLDTLLATAARLCNSDSSGLAIRDGEVFRYVANSSLAPEFWSLLRQRPIIPGRDTMAGRVALEGKVVQIEDVAADPDYALPEAVTLGKIRTNLGVPLLREGTVVGVFTLARLRVELYTERQIELVRTFADQAVIAIENARLLTELRARTDDLQESLEYQTATSDVLKVISRSTFDLTPVLQYVLETAMRLCRTHGGSIFRLEGGIYRWAVGKGLDPVYEEIERNTAIAPDEGTVVGRAALRRQTVQIVDAWNDPLYAQKESARITLARTMMGVPLLREGVPIGVIAMARNTVEPFTDSEIELVTTFADQAVIAIENARLLNELQSRQAELRVTFDNMGDAVIMFDGAQRLVAWNRNFQQMLDITDDFLATPRTYAEFVAHLTARGEFAVSAPPDVGLGQEGEVRPIRYERTRPDGRVLEVRRNPVPGGGFVFIYADITERKRTEEGLHAAREAAENALADLKAAQANLIQSEKMASLGQLTAGIAHEIKNPLNFVNNFANLSNELLGELKETAAPAFATLDSDKRDEIDETMALLTGNLEKIQEHGKRADGIVKSMLAHSRGGSGDRRDADLNALVEESLNLAYHGARAQDQNFNITLERDYDKSMKPIELVPQDVTRVFLNLCGNGFYAANKRRKDGGAADFRPVLKVATRELGDAVEVRIRDNGTGIPPDVKDKLFQPFFTTKPTGEGTGLGLSISYDIVTQQHGGTIAVDSRVGDFTEFTIRLPRNRQTAKRGGTA
jgi:two-component system, NtrC family, sensor kinase